MINENEEHIIKKMVRDTILKDVERDLEKVEKLEFLERNKFRIMREKVWYQYDLCPKCQGIGILEEDYGGCYQHEYECFRCKGTGKYIDSSNFIKYFHLVRNINE